MNPIQAFVSLEEITRDDGPPRGALHLADAAAMAAIKIETHRVPNESYLAKLTKSLSYNRLQETVDDAMLVLSPFEQDGVVSVGDLIE